MQGKRLSYAPVEDRIINYSPIFEELKCFVCMNLPAYHPI